MEHNRKQPVKVSVIILTYNAVTRIDESVSRFQRQTLEEIQLIYVDNASTDGTVERLYAHREKDSRIVVIPRKNNIFSGGINSGLAQAEGEYILMSGDDDWVDEDCLEISYQKAKALDLDLLVFNARDVYEDASLSHEVMYGRLKFDQYHHWKEPITGKEFWKREVKTQGTLGSISNYFVKKELLDEENIKFHNNTHYFSDSLYGYHVVLASQRVFFEETTYLNYFIRKGSSMRNLEHDKACQKQYRKHALICYEELIQLFQWYGVTGDTHPVVYSYLDFLKEIILRVYQRGVPEMDLSAFYLSLLHLAQSHEETPLLTGDEVAMTFLSKEETPSAFGDTGFAFFGSGLKGKRTLAHFQAQGLSQPVCICDNSKALHGTFVEGIPVVSLEEGIKTYGVKKFLITSSDYYTKICQQIRQEDKGKEYQVFKMLEVD